MASINIYTDAAKIYEITDLAKQAGNLRKAHLPYGVHTKGRNWVSLEFKDARSANKFRDIMRPRRKGLRISKYFSEPETSAPRIES